MRDGSDSPSSGGFQAVLVISFGGPQGLADIRPFLENVIRGRRLPPQRVEEVARHYELFNGVSPITEITRRQAEGVRARLQARGIGLPTYVGMRHWHPFLADTLRAMSQAGVRRAIGFIAAAHHCYSSCGQYKENVAEAKRTLRERGLPDVEIAYVESWYDHPGFIGTLARHAEAALLALDASIRDRARMVFTAHSIPRSMADCCRYERQLGETARLVTRALDRRDYALVYQSRSGRPEDPWLEPDVCEYLRAERARGLEAVVLAPIGFICEHIEVLYDLDVRAAEVCRELRLPMARAQTPNDDPLFIETMADLVRDTYERYRRFPPLPIVLGQSIISR